MSDAISGLPLSGVGQIADLLAGNVPRGGRADAANGGTDKERIIQAAKDFESVLIHKLLSEMRNTIPESGLLGDGTSEQVEGIFWMFLSRHLANSGGIGLWKEIYRQATQPDEAANTPATVEQLL